MPVIYGRRRVGGTVVFMETVNNKELFVVYALAGHEIDSFEPLTIQINGRSIDDSTVFRQGYAIADGVERFERKDASNLQELQTLIILAQDQEQDQLLTY